MIDPNPLVKENNDKIKVEEQDRLRKLAMEDMGQMVKIKEKKKKDGRAKQDK